MADTSPSRMTPHYCEPLPPITVTRVTVGLPWFCDMVQAEASEGGTRFVSKVLVQDERIEGLQWEAIVRRSIEKKILDKRPWING